MGAQGSLAPEWLNEEVSLALATLTGKQAGKKEATVLQLAEATAQGESWTAVFARPDTCAKKVWYGYTAANGQRIAGWCEDAAIQHALAVATARARWWVRVKRGQAVQDALDTLVDGSEDAARQIINLVRYGAVLFGADGQHRLEADVKEVLAAAKEVLDRVSALTATKQQAGLTLSSDQFSALMKQAQQRAALLEAEAEQGWSEERRPETRDRRAESG
jgi:hypothetical protein